jgi:hypothetical protein
MATFRIPSCLATVPAPPADPTTLRPSTAARQTSMPACSDATRGPIAPATLTVLSTFATMPCASSARALNATSQLYRCRRRRQPRRRCRRRRRYGRHRRYRRPCRRHLLCRSLPRLCPWHHPRPVLPVAVMHAGWLPVLPCSRCSTAGRAPRRAATVQDAATTSTHHRPLVPRRQLRRQLRRRCCQRRSRPKPCMPHSRRRIGARPF